MAEYKMMSNHSSLFAIVLTPAFCVGCGALGFTNNDVESVSNSERVVNVWDGDADRPTVAMCLEYATAVGEENTRQIELSGALGGSKSVSLSYQSATSLAQIYTVNDIMQFGHAAMYRLCEAAANGLIDNVQYAVLLNRVLDSMDTLLAQQGQNATLQAFTPLAVAHADLVSLTSEHAKLEKKRAHKNADGTTTLSAEEEARFQELATELLPKARANFQEILSERAGKEASEEERPAADPAPKAMP